MKPLLAILLLFCLVAGCRFPSVVVGQKTVPPPVEKAPALQEAERQAADLIASTIETPVELVPVAKELSQSLGYPNYPLSVSDLPKSADAVIASLRAENIKLHKQLEKQKTFLRKYAGNKIEDTGWDITGWLGGTGVLALVAVLIFVPGAVTVLMLIIRRLRTTLVHVATSMEQFRVEDPKAASSLEDWQAENMDNTNKKDILWAQKQIPMSALKTAQDYVSQNPSTK
jgi:hypothetical protein